LQRKELIDAIHENPNLHGEAALWLCVIFDAIESINAGPKEEGYQQAKSFLLEPGTMFEIFCEANDFDTDRLRKLVNVPA